MADGTDAIPHHRMKPKPGAGCNIFIIAGSRHPFLLRFLFDHWENFP